MDNHAIGWDQIFQVFGVMSAILLIIVGIIFKTLYGICKENKKEIDSLKEKTVRHEERMKAYSEFNEQVQATQKELVSQTIDAVLLKLPTEVKGNPYTLQERNSLLERYKRNDLSLNEAKRLKEILEEEKRNAMRSSATDPWLIFALGILLGGLAGLIIGLAASGSKNG